MKILVIARGLPTPPHGGGAHRFYNICKGLAERAELVAATQAQNGAEDPLISPLFTKTIALPKAPPVRLARRVLHRLLFGCHLQENLRRPDYLKTMRAEIERLIDAEAPDLVYVNGLAIAQYVCWKRRAVPVITDFCDCAWLLYRRQANLRTSLTEKLADIIEAHALLRFELKICRFSSRVLFVSDIDRLELQKFRPHAQLMTVPLIIDGNYFRSQTELANPYPDPNALNIVFSGVMSYLPNTDAALWFARDIFPRLRAKAPDALFWIVGHEPTPEVLALRELEGVYVTGTVDDIRPYISHASIVVSPLRSGAGVKTKILTALAMEAKVVCTPLSIEGTELKDELDVLVARTADDFVSKILVLRDSPETADNLARRGRQAVLHRHSIRAQNDVLFTIVDTALGLRSAQPSPACAAT